jgi:anti-sigma factor RsiW
MSADVHDLERDLRFEQDVHRYVDCALDAEGRARIERAMQDDAALARKVEAFRRQRDGLQKLFAALPDTRARIADAPQRRQPPLFRLPRLRDGAIAASLLAAGAIGGWSGAVVTADLGGGVRYAGRIDPVAMEGFSAHRVFVVDRRHPVEVGRDEEAHLVAWLSNRMEREILAPDFSSAGLELVGGRLLPSVDGPSAQLMYENADGDRVTLYFRAGHTEPKDGVIETDGDLRAVLWASHELNYAVIGGVDTKELLALSRLTGLKDMRGPSGNSDT